MNVAQEKSAALALGASVLEQDDPDYPPLLREIHDPPARLYVKGDTSLLRGAHLAVVGSRRASAAALRLAQSLTSELSAVGLHICSGLALGIDSAAHEGALASGGKTIAVMATGIDRVYPRHNRGLAQEIVQAGCLVTEFPPGTAPLRHNFPRRNRIISGMSLGVLVVEAALPSGSLITATSAMEQNREVFTLPWSPLHEGGRGCLKLLREGAKMVQQSADVLEELGPLYAALASSSLAPLPTGAGSDSWLLDLVGFEVVALDELVRRSARPPEQVLAELSTLELAGQLERRAGGYIRR